MDFSQYVFSFPYFGWLLRGVVMTLLISVASGALAALIGFLILQCHMSTRRSLRCLGIGFVALFRNLPLLPMLLFLTFAVPGLWARWSGTVFPSGLELNLLLAGLSLNSAAYVAEILRAGVGAVADEQVGAARTLGLAPRAIKRHVIYPQAVRVVAPALASRFIHNAKNSTMALVVPLPLGLMEVVGQAGRIAGQTFSWAEPLIFAAVIHLSLALGIGYVLNRWAASQQVKIESGQ